MAGSPVPELSYDQLIDWIRLARTPGIGAKTFRYLLNRFGAASEIVAHQSEWSGRQKQTEIPAPAVAEREFAAAAKVGLKYLPVTDPRYPRALAALDDAPPLLTVKGNLEARGTPLIAVVGARNATVNGRRFAKTVAAGLA